MLRRHEAPEPPGPGLALVLADASAPPFMPGRFDLVLTPWFIDVAGEPVARVAAPHQRAARARRTLDQSRFAGVRRRRARRRAEPRGTCRAAAARRVRAPAGAARRASPISARPPAATRGIESVVTFCARKEREVPSPAAGRELPDWIRRTRPARAGPAGIPRAGAVHARLRLPARHDRRRAHDPGHGAAHGAAEAHARRRRPAGHPPLPGARPAGSGPPARNSEPHLSRLGRCRLSWRGPAEACT